ncbi:MAG: MBL fold metallo-hydrolase [Actinomycetota bacterium]|nr:MBL fold metallo-hydrolase [Actinomycetota bacterium]
MTHAHHLVEIGQGVFAFLNPERGFGHANVGLIIDTDGLTIVDCSATPAEGTELRERILELTAALALPIRRVVVTSSRIPFAGGSDAFRQSAFYASDETSDELDEPVNPVALRALLPQFAGDYHDEFATRPATHTITDEAWITAAAHGIMLPGESLANLVVHVPGTDTVFAGALGSFGVTPLVLGDPFAWMQSLEVLEGLARTIVPGHGSIGGSRDLRELSDYLHACIAADGDPEAMVGGPWDGWSDRRFDPVNTERAARLARGDHSFPQSMLDLLGFGRAD